MEIEFEEIEGKRYAVWTSQNEPFGANDTYTWSELGAVLFGLCLFWFFFASSIMFVAVGIWAPSFAITMMAVNLGVLVVHLVSWAYKKRRRIATRRFEAWIAREPDVVGIPCSLTQQGIFGAIVDYGLLDATGDGLLFVGPRYRALFRIDDAVGGRFDSVMKFDYKTPVGARSAKLKMGGPSRDGWTQRLDAYQAAAALVDPHRPSDEQRPTVYPPLRLPQIRFERGYLTKTVPLMVAAYFATFAIGPLIIEALYRTVKHRSNTSPAELLSVCLLLVITFAVIIAGGYMVRARIQAFNRKVDRLAARSTPSA